MNEFIHGTVNDLLRFGYYDVFNLEIYDNLLGIEIVFKSKRATMYILWEIDDPLILLVQLMWKNSSEFIQRKNI